MFKKSLSIFIAIALVFAFASISMAIDVNIYGASAQYTFWSSAAYDYLVSIGCTGVGQSKYPGEKNAITRGFNCPRPNTTPPVYDTVYIRYASKASYDGIYSCLGTPPPPEAGGQPTCSGVGARYRDMADPNGATWAAKPNFGVVANLDCYEVTIGASDVDGQTFGQYTEGQEKGCLGGPYITRNIVAINTSTLANYRPVVVPFAFFINDAILTGNPAWQDPDPNDPNNTVPDIVDPNVVLNLTRLQAVLIFSGSAIMWDDFGIPWPHKYIGRCMRHAGSGTHATVDAAIMRQDTWPMWTFEVAGFFWFNDGSSDMMNCIQANCTNPTTDAVAVGYADADKNAGGGWANVILMQYQGAYPVKSNITNGVYPFWSAQWLFECDPSRGPVHEYVADLATFASDPNNIPDSKKPYWAAQDEMKVEKQNDRSYPKFK